MKKVLSLLVLAGIAFAGYWFFIKKNDESPREKDKPLAITTNTNAFSQRFEIVLTHYYTLRDAFVKSDGAQVDEQATPFLGVTDSLMFTDLKADTAIIATAQSLKGSIVAETQALLKSPKLEDKRRSFQIISDAIYDLIRTVKFDKEMVYQIHCPMAFDNAGANWLSKTDDVVNPYFGDKMLHCGEAVDSVDFRPGH